jgi:hypothetical protein
MEIIYAVSTGTNENYKRRHYVENIIPFLPRTTFIVKGKNETECRNRILAYFKALYFDFDGEIEEYYDFDGEIEQRITNSISFMLTKWVDDEYYCRAINVRAIRTIKDEIYYL